MHASVYASALGIGFMVYNTKTEGYNHKYRSDIFLPIGFVTSVYEVIEDTKTEPP